MSTERRYESKDPKPPALTLTEQFRVHVEEAQRHPRKPDEEPPAFKPFVPSPSRGILRDWEDHVRERDRRGNR